MVTFWSVWCCQKVTTLDPLILMQLFFETISDIQHFSALKWQFSVVLGKFLAVVLINPVHLDIKGPMINDHLQLQ